VYLQGAHIGGKLNCTGEFKNPEGRYALKLKRATVSGPLCITPAKLEGNLNLTDAKTSRYQDKEKSRSEFQDTSRACYELKGHGAIKRVKR
jgi:hypothetical protein